LAIVLAIVLAFLLAGGWRYRAVSATRTRSTIGQGAAALGCYAGNPAPDDLVGHHRLYTFCARFLRTHRTSFLQNDPPSF
ncbi:hypothetical protein NL514_27485, partial [Klebsiella pneumoniae]|nr:hypothetical protein [Klebsiella pneumoniae]